MLALSTLIGTYGGYEARRRMVAQASELAEKVFDGSRSLAVAARKDL
jgi:hypothetical protein